jgi:hypothetical protein
MIKDCVNMCMKENDSLKNMFFDDQSKGLFEHQYVGETIENELDECLLE